MNASTETAPQDAAEAASTAMVLELPMALAGQLAQMGLAARLGDRHVLTTAGQRWFEIVVEEAARPMFAREPDRPTRRRR